MLNKKLTIIITIAIIITGFLIKSILSNQKETIKRRPMKQNERQLNIVTIQNEDIQTRITIAGHLYAYDKVEIYAEVSGILLNTPKRFKAGTRFDEGEILIQIDDAVYKNNVLAQKSSLLNQLTLLLPDLSIDFPESASHWQDYLSRLDLKKPLAELPQPESDKERYYIASRNIFNQFFAIKAMEETLAKYTIEASFSGVVTEANINQGTLVRVGQKLGEFTNTDMFELPAAAGIHDVQHLKPGDPVILTSDEIEGQFKGKIQRINAVIDKTSQSVMVYITSHDKRLKDGMYCKADIKSSPIREAVRIPRKAVVGNGHVFTVQDSILTLTSVEILGDDKNHFIVKGLENGTRILGEPSAGLSDGMNINQIQKN